MSRRPTTLSCFLLFLIAFISNRGSRGSILVRMLRMIVGQITLNLVNVSTAIGAAAILVVFLVVILHQLGRLADKPSNAIPTGNTEDVQSIHETSVGNNGGLDCHIFVIAQSQFRLEFGQPIDFVTNILVQHRVGNNIEIKS